MKGEVKGFQERGGILFIEGCKQRLEIWVKCMIWKDNVAVFTASGPIFRNLDSVGCISNLQTCELYQYTLVSNGVGIVERDGRRPSRIHTVLQTGVRNTKDAHLLTFP
jgi:hypothetical protein